MRDRHRRQRAPHQQADRRPEQEGEDGVAEGDHVAGPELQGTELAAHEGVERVGRPGEHAGKAPTTAARQRDHDQLHREPTRRVTPWVHTIRKVPFSSSRAISGAPQKAPSRAGSRSEPGDVDGPSRRCPGTRGPPTRSCSALAADDRAGSRGSSARARPTRRRATASADAESRGPELPPGQPGHRRTSGRERGRPQTRGPMVTGRRAPGPPGRAARRPSGSWIGADSRATTVVCRAVWLALTTWSPAGGRESSRAAGEPVVGARRSSTSPATCTCGRRARSRWSQTRSRSATRCEESTTSASVGDELHQALQEVAPGQRVQARDRLVEKEQLRPLGDGERERELRALAAGQPAGLLRRVEAELRDPLLGDRGVPARVQLGAEPQVVGDASRRRRACPARRSPPGRTVPGRRRALRRAPRSCRSSGGSARRPGCSSVDLPAPLGPTSPTMCPAGSRACSPERPRRPYRLPSPSASSDPGHRAPSTASRERACGTGPRCSRRPARRRGPPEPRSAARRSGPWAASEPSASVPVTKVPTPAARVDQALVLQLAVGLEHGVRVDGHVRHHVLDRRELVALGPASPAAWPAGPAGRAAGRARLRTAQSDGTRSWTPLHRFH